MTVGVVAVVVAEVTGMKVSVADVEVAAAVVVVVQVVEDAVGDVAMTMMATDVVVAEVVAIMAASMVATHEEEVDGMMMIMEIVVDEEAAEEVTMIGLTAVVDTETLDLWAGIMIMVMGPQALMSGMATSHRHRLRPQSHRGYVCQP